MMTPRHLTSLRSVFAITVATSALLGIVGCASMPGSSTATPESSARPVPSTPAAVDLSTQAPLPPNPDVLMIGDSFTEGYGASTPASGWAAIAAGTLGWNATIDGIGGTGFAIGNAADGGSLDYRQRLAAHASNEVDFDLVVLQGGLNDWQVGPTVEAEQVRGAVAAAHGLWPQAQIVVFGPAQPIAAIDQTTLLPVIRAAATESGAIFIDPQASEPWINAANTRLFDSGDGLHLNDAGHAYLAARFIAEFESLFE